MSESKRKASRTQALVEAFPNCCLCGGLRKSATCDHIPPISLFDNSHRPKGLETPACDPCNRGASTADLIAAIISRWNYGAEQQELKDHSRLVRRLKFQAPQVVNEWTKIGRTGAGQLSARRHLLSQGVKVPRDAPLVSIGPETIRHLNLFAYKITLGLFFAKMGRGLPKDGVLCAYWRTKEDYHRGGVPRELLEIFSEHSALRQGKWDTSKQFEFRFDTNREEGLFGCLARIRRGLYIVGFAVEDRNVMPKDDLDDWISPQTFLEVLNDPRFERRLG